MGPFFSCLESSYSSEALDSFGWRCAVFFFCLFQTFTLRPFSMLSSEVLFFFLASMEAICILLRSVFFGFFFLF